MVYNLALWFFVCLYSALLCGCGCEIQFLLQPYHFTSKWICFLKIYLHKSCWYWGRFFPFLFRPKSQSLAPIDLGLNEAKQQTMKEKIFLYANVHAKRQTETADFPKTFSRSKFCQNEFFSNDYIQRPGGWAGRAGPSIMNYQKHSSTTILQILWFAKSESSCLSVCGESNLCCCLSFRGAK